MKYTLTRICFTISALLLYMGFTFSQGVAIGQWREHLPYNSLTAVVDVGDFIYASTQYALFSYNKVDGTLTRYSKANILSDVGVSTIAYHKKRNTLLIGYNNGNLDLLRDGKIRNYADIKRANILGSKKINQFRIVGDSVYLSCDFGIVIFDLSKREFRDTYIIGPNGNQVPVYSVALMNDSIFAGSTKGIYKASLQSPNLADFNYWKLDSGLLRDKFRVNIVEVYNNNLVVNMTIDQWDTDTSFARIEGNWVRLDNFTNANKACFRIHNNSIVVAMSGSIGFFNSDFELINNYWSFNDVFINPVDIVFDNANPDVLWIADKNYGLIRNQSQWINSFIYPTGPFTDKVYSLSSAPGKIIGVPGGRDVSWNNIYTPMGYYSFENETWNNRHGYNVAGFDTIWDALAVAVDPLNSNRLFISAYGRGVLEVVNNQLVKVHNTTNTTITGTVGWPGNVSTAGIRFDRNNNLWVTTSYTNQCIHVMTPQGQWHSYTLPVVSSTDVFSDVIIDKLGNKWIIMPKSGGMVVFNENGTFTNTADDNFKRLTNSIGNGNLPSMNVYSIAEDKDGRIWIGTDKGIAVFYFPQNIFTGQNFDAQQILVEVGGHVQPLMVSETVNSIVVDGANRKWIATEKGGVFLLSPDGTEQVHHFTTKNSPILSNSIASIAIMPQTGEVFFGTYSGLISYKGTATEAPPSYDDTVRVYAYPNPVHPEYNGTIAIKNLVYNSWVKITDIHGKLIFETRALGGQAVWNGKLPDGSKPNSGVFLVFATNDDGSETVVTKILFIN